MITPEKIWVWIEQLHGYESLSASDQPRADGFPTVEYTRADLIHTLTSADYVAGLEAAAEALWSAVSTSLPAGKRSRLAQPLRDLNNALAASAASPDTRVVTTALLRQLNKLSGYVHENEIRAIIGDTGK